MPLNTAVMFGKATDEWETPQGTFDELNLEFGFDIDVAAALANLKCWEYFDAEADALTRDWNIRKDGRTHCWCNPPYSKCAEFVAKAAAEARKGVTTVMLIPSRTDTKYWHEFIWDREKHQPRPGVEVRFIKGRLKFGNSQNSAPFPSVVIVFRPVESA